MRAWRTPLTLIAVTLAMAVLATQHKHRVFPQHGPHSRLHR
jgi:hypothetical protein